MISIKLVVEPPPRNPNGGEAMDAIGAAALKSKFEKLQEEFKSVTVKLQEVERSVEKQKSDNNAIQQRVQDIDRANTELRSELEIQGEELERDIWQEFTELENDQQCNYLKSMMLQVKNLRRECDAKGAKLLAVQQDLEKAAAMGTRTENSNPTNHGNVTGKTVLQDPYERPKKKIRPMFRTSPLF
ncbi:hypothetical protein GNI_128380 [Gregarina niphandrodes]|uniref:Uncharacterized protein n=1 Tax=Gregarina niphandrodes TaxID=110365 RepID=A0A023B1Q4_GRENI|nr:hypothetical protein GNI_128380 [Gregarina niphandrodes]EZG48826.1 hypothetical protein GNI_128380 [Gregarina niphandrodes]|eukprot:XP_011132078.1 hypothetical protein GNI_128380 [Gregarina niphandrodes]